MNLDHLHLSKQLCHRLYVASNATTRAYRPYLDNIGITYPQYVVMMALWQHADELKNDTAQSTANPALDIKKLQQLTLIDSGALSLILKKLTEKSLIDIEQSEQDKRVRLVSLTPQGIELQKQAADIPQSLRCKITSLTEQELKQFAQMMDKIIADLA